MIIGKVDNSALLNNMKKVAREVFGIVPSKIHKNKKKYSRKKKHKGLEDNDILESS